MQRFGRGVYILHNGESVENVMEVYIDNERIEILGQTISTVYAKDNLYWNKGNYNTTKCFIKFMGSKRDMSIGNASNVR